MFCLLNKSCPDFYYKDNITKSCQKCPTNIGCRQCKGIDTCKTCDLEYFLYYEHSDKATCHAVN